MGSGQQVVKTVEMSVLFHCKLYSFYCYYTAQPFYSRARSLFQSCIGSGIPTCLYLWSLIYFVRNSFIKMVQDLFLQNLSIDSNNTSQFLYCCLFHKRDCNSYTSGCLVTFTTVRKFMDLKSKFVFLLLL